MFYDMRYFSLFSLFCLLCLQVLAQKKPSPTDCVGIIAGKCITLQEFEEAVREETKRSGVSEKQAREIVWNMYLYDLVFEPELKKASISLTPKQQEALLWGDSTEVHPSVLENFHDQENNRFDTPKRQRLREKMQKDKATQQRVESFMKSLVKDKLRSDYEQMMANSTYITRAEALREIQDMTAKARIRYLFVPYEQMPDSLFAPTEEELAKKLQENPKAYPTREDVVLEHIALPIIPTKADTSKFMQQTRDLMREWKLASNPFEYANKHNEHELKEFPYKSMRELPAEFFRKYPKPYRGGFFGPFWEGKQCILLYLHDIRKDSSVSVVRASHIFFRVGVNETDEKKAKVRKEAEDVLNKLKAGADFVEMAKKY
ncbi:MAG: hypothetical protein EAZ95_16540, partial [Bacteroidetes bacterium]